MEFLATTLIEDVIFFVFLINSIFSSIYISSYIILYHLLKHYILNIKFSLKKYKVST